MMTCIIDPVEVTFPPCAVREIDERTKRVAHDKQTRAVKAKNKLSCPPWVLGDDANEARIYDFEGTSTDHLAAWN